jgi:PAS domain S-box-containing protein
VEWRAELLASAAEHLPFLLAVFEGETLRLHQINAAGLSWIAPGERTLPMNLTLPDLMAVAGHDQLLNVMLPQSQVLGKWSGECALRDIWGSETPVRAVLLHREQKRGAGARTFTLMAVRQSVEPKNSAGPVRDDELLHALLEAVPDSMYFKDRQSRFLRVSRSMAGKDGRTDTSSLLGLTDFDRFTAEHAQPAYEAEQQIMRTGLPVLNREEKETWPDGHVTWVATSKFPLRDRSGAITGTFGISRDITEHKLDEAARQEMETKLQLAQKLESIGQLAAGIAHEINTPTQYITDNTRFLGDAFTQLERPLSACGRCGPPPPPIRHSRRPWRRSPESRPPRRSTIT